MVGLVLAKVAASCNWYRFRAVYLAQKGMGADNVQTRLAGRNNIFCHF